MSDGASPPRAPGEPFYRKPATDAARFEQALAVEGLDQEIAVLRMRLDELIKEQQVDYRLVAQVMNTLVRAVTAQHRISRKARKDLADNLAALLNSLGDQLLPPDR